MTVLVGVSSLPFFAELITNTDGIPYSWVPDWGIRNALTDVNGKVFSYSTYRVFVYYLLAQFYSFVAWVGWFSVAKSKPYRLAILLGVLSSSYHIFLILSNSRKTNLNNFDLKLMSTAVVCCVLFVLYYYFEKIKKAKLQYALQQFSHSPKKIISPKILLFWLAIFVASTAPYFHDIVTVRGEGIKGWVPQLGLESFLTDTEGYVWGFNSYRIFILTLAIQLFAQVGWAGWLHDSKYALYRPFLVVPVGLSLYQIVVILFDQTETSLNSPDIKLLLILSVAAIICYFYFFRNKRFGYKITTTPEVPRSAQTKNH